MEMKDKLAEYLMAHGVLKNADAQTMAQEIIDMLINNLIERNHELEQKELMRSASRPAEAEAMRNVLEESKRMREQLDTALWDIQAYRGALGYSIPGNHSGKLKDGTTPQCGMCNSEYRRTLEAQLEAVQKANAELREFALTHFSREQVKPLVELISDLDHRVPKPPKAITFEYGNEILDYVQGEFLPKALAHARAVGMEDKP